ncbi:hypothetical protein AMAG_07339 [Allomyces macrogynus ATCC 38327]|uniref:Uncharacterized protein n=1 Tax=Allomyces macrogynus (strain ATCC 38327) TaxID=578462 RepID=A0A0L0SIC5_ALLM3|nr:hypothetical protein GGF31_002498 [Allomyces arbusculus]KNE62085.1 hypothetical protein AMAG_07339 [Allomyces macrogynus ATCC 38327]|eukprot:KNE62085.1 hypothetical protein AMAG_07339 [Allomyces macrogynus ATCC 38327]
MSVISYFRQTARQTPEIVPLVSFVSVVCAFAVYSSVKKVVSDQDLRFRENQGMITWEERLSQLHAKKH